MNIAIENTTTGSLDFSQMLSVRGIVWITAVPGLGVLRRETDGVVLMPSELIEVSAR